MKKRLFVIAMVALSVAMSCSKDDEVYVDPDPDFFKITSEETLGQFVDSLATLYALDDTAYPTLQAKLMNNITLTEDWTPIPTTYGGTFKGNGKTISGLKISSDASRLGFFAECNGATIQDLTIEGEIENTGSGSEMTGAIAGKAYNTTFSSCATTSATTISGIYRNTGGLVGWAVGSTFTNCKNYATVKGAQFIGGVVGTVSTDSQSTFTNCTNYGAVSDQLGSVSGHLGGIVGYYGGGSTMSGCTNEGNVTSTYSLYVGGLVGRGYDGSIKDCTNKGAVLNINTSGTDTGGIVGYNVSEVSSSTNSGTITSYYNTLGGIAGYNNGSITSSTNSGSVIGYGDNNGGIAGNNYNGYITSSTNSGSVKGSGGNNGGIAGNNYSASTDNAVNGAILYSTNKGTVTAEGENTGGIAGYSTRGNITSCANSGKVSGVKFTAGILGQSSIYTKILDASNSGEVESSDSYCGGIVGYVSNGYIFSSNNTAKVTALGHVAGIVGEASKSTVFNCYNTGAVEGTGTDDESIKNVAGLVGHLFTTATLRNCYNLGSVTSSTDCVGGLVGTCVSGAELENCYSAATVVGEGSAVDGGIGSYAGVASQCYYDSTLYTTTSNDSATAQTTAELQGSDFVDTLNNFVASYNNEDGTSTTPDVLALKWKAVSGGYPTFE